MATAPVFRKEKLLQDDSIYQNTIVLSTYTTIDNDNVRDFKFRGSYVYILCKQLTNNNSALVRIHTTSLVQQSINLPEYCSKIIATDNYIYCLGFRQVHSVSTSSFAITASQAFILGRVGGAAANSDGSCLCVTSINLTLNKVRIVTWKVSGGVIVPNAEIINLGTTSDSSGGDVCFDSTNSLFYVLFSKTVSNTTTRGIISVSPTTLKQIDKLYFPGNTLYSKIAYSSFNSRLYLGPTNFASAPITGLDEMKSAMHSIPLPMTYSSGNIINMGDSCSILPPSNMPSISGISDIVVDNNKNYIYVVYHNVVGIVRLSSLPQHINSQVLSFDKAASYLDIDSTNQKLYIMGAIAVNNQSEPVPGGVELKKCRFYIANLYTPAEPPRDLVVTCGEAFNTIDLKWTNPTAGETSTYIERSVDQANWSVIGTVSGGITVYTDTNVTENVVYYYRVRELTGGIYGEYSGVEKASCEWYTPTPGSSGSGLPSYDPLGTYSGNRYTLEAPNKVNLYWIYKVHNNCGQILNKIDGFKIYRKRDDQSIYSLIDTIGASIRTYQDTIDITHTYSYYIVPYNSQRDGTASQIYSVNPAPLNVPTTAALSLSSASGGTAVIGWTYLSNTVGYKVWRKSSSTDSPWKLIATITSSTTISYSDTTLKLITPSKRLYEYQYKMQGYNNNGDGAFSNTITVGKT